MNSEVDAFVGRRIRRRRRLMGMTQQELGATCGVCFQQVQKYESGRTRLSIDMLWSLRSALKVDIGYFFAGLEEHPAAAGSEAEQRASPHLAAASLPAA